MRTLRSYRSVRVVDAELGHPAAPIWKASQP